MLIIMLIMYVQIDLFLCFRGIAFRLHLVGSSFQEERSSNLTLKNPPEILWGRPQTRLNLHLLKKKQVYTWKNGWLEYNYVSFLGPALFSGAVAVSFREHASKTQSKISHRKGSSENHMVVPWTEKHSKHPLKMVTSHHQVAHRLKSKHLVTAFLSEYLGKPGKGFDVFLGQKNSCLESGIPQAPRRVLNNP